ncbi:uncharacterized protein LY89DRAFT_691090 [Mollisia scopiformis]|uniref:Uncharacterized protein n=1 Tax=Mollisia scopiformis TaxID=149040 RepID=A0A132B707_MOLSC|nr:uncharacterized protein LY89DRAFT_691090 [Mollisia scopiformis]KUJ08190.1 hypothetical protein LY89DRAFT_691090 [Mollisia scopiformis]
MASGRMHLLNVKRKKVVDTEDIPESSIVNVQSSVPRPSYPPSRTTFASETKSETNVQVSIPHPAGVSRSLSTPDSSGSQVYQVSHQTSNRSGSDQFPKSFQPSYTSTTDEQGIRGLAGPLPSNDSRNLPSQYGYPLNLPRKFEGNPSYAPDNYYVEEPINVVNQYPRPQKPAKPEQLPYENNPLLNGGTSLPSPVSANGSLAGWNWQDALGDQKSAPQQRPISQIVSPRSSRCAGESERLSNSKHRRYRDALENNQASDMRNNLYWQQYNRASMASADSIPEQRRSTASYNSDRSRSDGAGEEYEQRDIEMENRYTGETPRRSATYGVFTGPKSDESGMPEPIFRRSTGFEQFGGAGPDPRRRYTSDSSSPPSSSASDFQWDVNVRWDDPDAMMPSFQTAACTIKFDSGCERSNWVSESIVWRLGAHIRPLESAANFVAFNGQPMRTSGMTSLAFERVGGVRGYRAVFLVATGDDVPFDMVLGATDSVRYGILVKPRESSDASVFLGLAAAKQTAEEKKKQEERDAEQKQTRKDQKDKRKHLPIVRKKVKSEDLNQNASSSRNNGNSESSRRNTTR